LVLISGCGVELMATTATQATLQAKQAQAMQGQVGRVSEQMGRTNLERAIQTYKAEKGSFPATLDELVPNYVPAMPRRADGTPYGYDAVTGAVLDGPAASAGAVTAQDMQTMQAIRDAINRYGTAVGYYPGTLDALYPAYLGKPPRTSAGEPFLYNNQNGAVTHPRQASAAAPAGPAAVSGAGVGGSGPKGEVMTGVGMQQQLGNGSNAGASAAQGHMNRSLQQSVGGQNDRQNAAMDQLGL
jgi:hypothetical protein